MRGIAHETLRLQSRDLHNALELRLPLSMLANPVGYVDYLRVNWACVGIEKALERAGINRVLLDWNERRRRESLAADLKVLGVNPPLSIDLAIDSDIGSLLGWSYVLEGSRLGAKVILQTIMTGSDPVCRGATAFLRHGAGERLWATYKAELAQIDGQPAAIVRACDGANAAFRHFLD
jgi:heme oxygenase